MTEDWIALCVILAVLACYFGCCWWQKEIEVDRAYSRIKQLRSEQFDLRDQVERLQREAQQRTAKLPKRGAGGRFLKGL